jgi:hypothetical protein
MDSEPMVEVALGLAMAFFTLMVLAMVSMGAGGEGASTVLEEVAQLAAATPVPVEEQPSSPAGADDELIILFRGALYERDLQPLDTRALAAVSGSFVLAVEPSVPVSELQDLQAQVSNATVTIAVLDSAWLDYLEDRL